MTTPLPMLMPKSEQVARRKCLGRVRPKEIIDTDRFRLLVLPDGRHRMVPKLSAHFAPAQITASPPTTLDYGPKALAALARTYLNDVKGDCVIADLFRKLGLWTGNETGTAVQGTDQEVADAYATICGGGDPNADNGCVIIDTLDYWTKTGVTCNGQVHKIGGYVAVDWTNPLELKVAQVLFGSVRFGINLPQGWYDAPEGGVWDVVSGAAAQIAGGHDVGSRGYSVVGFTADGVVIFTWGGFRVITWAALAKKPVDGNDWGVEECYVELSPDWTSVADLAPSGVSAETLAADLQLLGQGTIPPLPIGPPPPPPSGNVVATLRPTGSQIQAGKTIKYTSPGHTPFVLTTAAAIHSNVTYQVVAPASAGTGDGGPLTDSFDAVMTALIVRFAGRPFVEAALQTVKALGDLYLAGR